MKNITVSVDNETYSRARIVAAGRGTTVTALVRDFLVELTSGIEADPDWPELWESVDSWGAEVGERPTRSRTYEGRA